MFRSVFSTSPSSFRNKEKGGKRSNNRYTVSNYWTWRTRRKRKGGRKKNDKIEKKKARRRQSRQMEDEVTLCTSKETVDLSRNVFIKEENRHKCRSTSLQVVAIMLEHSCAFLKMLEIEGTKWKEGRSGRVWGTSIKFIFVPREKKKKKKKGLVSPSIQFSSKRASIRSHGPLNFKFQFLKEERSDPFFSTESDNIRSIFLINNQRECAVRISLAYNVLCAYLVVHLWECEEIMRYSRNGYYKKEVEYFLEEETKRKRSISFLIRFFQLFVVKLWKGEILFPSY